MMRRPWQLLKSMMQAQVQSKARGQPDVSEGGGAATEAAATEAAATEAAATDSAISAGGFGDSIFQPGNTVLGRFRIVRSLGHGGMGEVYEAQDLQLGRIALKTIRAGIGQSSGLLRQFRQEVQLARRVSGPQICRIHDMFELPASGSRPAIPFLTMEYLDGVTLEKRRGQGPLSRRETLRLAQEICAGLHLIHEQGIVHRDLKPSNIMLCGTGDRARVVLTDFGLASRFHAADKLESATSLNEGAVSGAIAGTPQYMAPEQFEGKALTPAADIYALGVILYELVTGERPYAAMSPLGAAIRRASHLRPASSTGANVPRHWDRVIARCLEFDPEQRFSSATEVAKALSAGPASIRNIRADRPWILGLALAAMVAAAAYGIFAWWQTRQYYRPSVQAKHWYGTGVDAIHKGTYVKATHALKEAVDLEPKFAMAHIRLAEAWENLDFETDAQHEMLLAVPGERGLTPLEHLYAAAIRMTIAHDYAGAIDGYQAILGRLPEQERPDGYVDLGKAYERGGEPAKALAAYAQASKLDDQSASPCLRSAILDSRLNQAAEADAAFQCAEKLFAAEANLEGLAELDFQRGYTYNVRSKSDAAQVVLERALKEATTLGSTQLEIRAHAQLSSTAYLQSQYEEAVSQAQQAIRLARDNRLESWATDGLIRLANVMIAQRQFAQAEETLQEALQIANQSGQLRFQAQANITLAALMDMKNQPDEVVAPALAALNYYRQSGFFSNAVSAGLLLSRAQTAKGQYPEALRASLSMLETAERSGLPELRKLSEEQVGGVYLKMEDYPRALDHFMTAASAATGREAKAYEDLHCAGVLWRLGRYEESERALNSLPQTERWLLWSAAERLGALLSQERFRAAADLSKQVLSDYQEIEPQEREYVTLSGRIAEAHLHRGMSEGPWLSDTGSGPGKGDPSDLWERRLAAAELSVYLGHDPAAVKDSLAQAAAYFAATGQSDSELRSVCLGALAAQRSGDFSGKAEYSKKSVDILNKLQQTWGLQPYTIYITRPDLKTLLHMTEGPAL